MNLNTLQLPLSLKAWGTDAFERTFKQEMASLRHEQLPLQQSLSHSSYVSDQPFSPLLIKSAETHSHLEIKAGIFYTGIIAGCSCADDPTPLDTQNEYCELLVFIDRQTGKARIQLLQDD